MKLIVYITHIVNRHCVVLDFGTEWKAKIVEPG